MNLSQFQYLLSNQHHLKEEDIFLLEQFVQDYPFCTIAHQWIAKHHIQTSHIQRDEKLSKAAIFSNNRAHLKNYLLNTPSEEIAIQAEQTATIALQANVETIRHNTQEVVEEISTPEVTETPITTDNQDIETNNPSVETESITETKIEPVATDTEIIPEEISQNDITTEAILPIEETLAEPITETKEDIQSVTEEEISIQETPINSIDEPTIYQLPKEEETIHHIVETSEPIEISPEVLQETEVEKPLTSEPTSIATEANIIEKDDEKIAPLEENISKPKTNPLQIKPYKFQNVNKKETHKPFTQEPIKSSLFESVEQQELSENDADIYLQILSKIKQTPTQQTSNTSQKQSTTPSKPNNNLNHNKIIEQFIKKNPSIGRPQVDILKTTTKQDLSIESTKENTSLFTETLAKLTVKQKKFERAIYIYEQLILKYPEKKVYFANEIENIKKQIK